MKLIHALAFGAGFAAAPAAHAQTLAARISSREMPRQMHLRKKCVIGGSGLSIGMMFGTTIGRGAFQGM